MDQLIAVASAIFFFIFLIVYVLMVKRPSIQETLSSRQPLRRSDIHKADAA